MNREGPTSAGAGRLGEARRRGGLTYSGLYALRWLGHRVLDLIDQRLIAVEQAKGIVEPWAILSKRLSTDENRRLWDTYDWSSLGEEWTPSDEWKRSVVRELIEPHVRPGATVVEIGPGGGRWTEVLRSLASRLYLVDVSEMPLNLCRERFRDHNNVEYLLSDGRSVPVPASAIDVIWSFDCFVHINPLDIREYFREFSRTLRPGGLAVIHHAGPPQPGKPLRAGMRSDMTDRMAVEFARNTGLDVVSQSTRLVNPGDVLTVLRKPAAVR
jgi:ubiquinone/menaquinone biosynthesis C-methylase UbiE